MKKIVPLVVLFVLVVPALVLWAVSDRPSITLDQPPAAIGAATPIKAIVTAPRGARVVRAYVEQNGNRYPLFEQTHPSHRLLFFRHREAPQVVSFTAGTKNAPRLQDGKAHLVVEATANDFRGAEAEVSREVEVITKPPAVSADGVQHYINQGGSELVTFTPSGYVTDSGVHAGKYSFRSFPAPGKSGERFSLFAFPWDLSAQTVPVVYASNPAGTEATARFWYKLFPKHFRRRDLQLDDNFLQKVVNEIDPGGSGDLLSRFLKINGELRRQNNKTLADLRLKTEQRWLWTQPFIQLANSKVESQFADVRSYFYKGKKVDEQVHLGFDLSVTKNVPVAAANDGKVLWADRLGIYGNCVVVDHGYGLQSIYGHLSQIEVKPGEVVKRGQALGKSGATGLAGGDHLHFSMQVDGVQINPVEWWDQHWIQDRIFSKVK